MIEAGASYSITSEPVPTSKAVTLWLPKSHINMQGELNNIAVMLDEDEAMKVVMVLLEVLGDYRRMRERFAAKTIQHAQDISHRRYGKDV